jgi:hypothetical protein
VRVGVPLDGPVPIVSSTIGTAARASVGRFAARLLEGLTTHVRYAGQAQRRDATRTSVAPREGLGYGYYTLIAGQLAHAEATPEARKGLSRHFPIPVAILARLAVDTRYQGQSARRYSASSRSRIGAGRSSRCRRPCHRQQRRVFLRALRFPAAQHDTADADEHARHAPRRGLRITSRDRLPLIPRHALNTFERYGGGIPTRDVRL